MSLTPAETQKVAYLARIQLSETEIPQMAQELSPVLTFIETLSQIDVSQVEPLSHPLDATQPLRADVISESNQRELLQENAPEVKLGLFIVPAVIE